MGSFEWMELQTLTSEITASRIRLSTARADKDQRLARMLEEEIAVAEKRRNQLLAHISNHIAADPERGPGNGGEEAAGVEEEPPPLELVDRIDGPGEPPPKPAPKAARGKGGSIVWDQLTPADLERAKHDLVLRRAEILARHAEELKQLDTDQGQLDALEQAIGEFMRRFSAASPEPEVVVLGEERGQRLQGRA